MAGTTTLLASALLASTLLLSCSPSRSDRATDRQTDSVADSTARRSRSVEIQPELQSLYRDYGDRVLDCLVAFDAYITDSSTGQHADSTLAYYDSSTHKRIELMNRYFLRVKTDSSFSLTDVEVWCNSEAIMESVYIEQGNGSVEIAEILYTIPQTRHLFDKFLTVKGQYWGSLSSGQLSQLHDEVLRDLCSISAEQRHRFFIEYFQTYLRLSRSDGR